MRTLLDEVAAGLNPSEIEEILASIKHIHYDLGITVMLIEHVMELVMKISDRGIVLDSGLPVLQGVSLEVNQGETVSVPGANSAGKSTLLRAVMGTQQAFEDRILYKGREIQKLQTETIVRLGIAYVPEEKMLFGPLSVEENLMLRAYVLDNPQQVRQNLQFIYDLFPKVICSEKHF
jgi:ABC-type branched-subunit amino acid transport system ATPase component